MLLDCEKRADHNQVSTMYRKCWLITTSWQPPQASQ